MLQRKLLVTAIGCLMLLAVVLSAELDQIDMYVANIPMDTTAVTNATYTSATVRAYIDEVIIEGLSTVQNVQVQLYTATNTWSDAWYTIVTGSVAFQTNIVIRPRVPTVTTNQHQLAAGSNDWARIFLYGEKLILKSFGANRTNTNIRAKIKVER